MLNGLQLWDLDCLLPDCTRNLLDLHNGDVEHLINDWNLSGLLNSLDQGKLPLRHDSVVDDVDNRGGVAQQLACQEPVQEQRLKKLDGHLHSLHCGYTSPWHNSKRELCR